MKKITCISSYVSTSRVILSLFALLTLAPPLSLSAQTEEPSGNSGNTSPWVADFQQARKTASSEKKDIALLFTASDWLELAKIFDDKILSQENFLEAASKHYVLVRLDFPKDRDQQSKQTNMQNQLLMRAYRVRGLPTLVLTDELGRPYAITGYHDGGLTNWLEEFDQLRQNRQKRDALFASAKRATGVERAQLLAQALPDLPGNLAARFYRNIMDEVIQLDPENQTGRIGYYKLLIADVQYSDQMQKLAMKGEEAKMLELSEQYLKTVKLNEASRQSVLYNKLRIYEKQGDKINVEKTLQAIIAADPDSPQGKQAVTLLEKLGANSKK